MSRRRTDLRVAPRRSFPYDSQPPEVRRRVDWLFLLLLVVYLGCLAAGVWAVATWL